ncbi:hypothetical protein BS46_gp131 [Acinetobacter phage BS46]|nr:hypothetical protein BS46_gp131 [Acinetobacter phage BS46]
MKITEQDILMINQVFKDFEKFLKDGTSQLGYFSKTFGLCHNLFDLIEDNITNKDVRGKTEDISRSLFRSWGHFSGSYSYPVPFREDQEQCMLIREIVDIRHPTVTPQEVAYDYSVNLYDMTTDYGRLRLDLYQHIKDNIFDVINEL